MSNSEKLMLSLGLEVRGNLGQQLERWISQIGGVYIFEKNGKVAIDWHAATSDFAFFSLAFLVTSGLISILFETIF